MDTLDPYLDSQANLVTGEGIAERVYSSRRAKGLAQQELADRAGVSRATISRLENGHWEELSAGSLFRILGVLRWVVWFEQNQLPSSAIGYRSARDFIEQEYPRG